MYLILRAPSQIYNLIIRRISLKSSLFIFGCTESSLLQLCFVAELCLTLCDPTDCSPPGSSVHRISQARILEWTVISFSMKSSSLKKTLSK